MQTVTQANSLTMRMVQDLADLKAHVTQNMVTKAYLAETLGQYDLKNMVTKDDIVGMATKDDIANMATKDDIVGMATKAELSEFRTEVRAELREIRDAQGNVRETVRDVLRSELIAIQNRWLIGVVSISFSAVGLVLALLANERLTAILLENAAPISLALVIVGMAGLAVISRQK